MELFNTDRARFAVNGLLGVEIIFGTLAFWSHAFDHGQPAQFIVAALLTATFGFIAILSSGVVIRAVAAREAGASVTAGLVTFCGIVLMLIGAGMTWHGLAWADAQADLVPSDAHDWLLFPAAGMLSGLNFVAIYVFCRDLKSAASVLTLESPATVAARDLARHRHRKAA